MNPLISVVITTKNEEKNIENCLKSILAQTYPQDKIEIIVVDNNSTDKTKEIVSVIASSKGAWQSNSSVIPSGVEPASPVGGGSNPNIKLFNRGPERSAQRNHGMIEKSAGKYVMFVDADMILSPGLIASCVKKMESENCPALHIPEIVLGNNFFSRVRRFERTFYDGTVIDGARFFLKSAFVEVGGFDETMSGPEDWDIDKKIKKNGSVCLLKTEKYESGWNLADFISQRGIDYKNYGSVIYHNESEFNLKNYLAKKGYYAKSFGAYIDKWGKNDPDIKKQLGLYYRFFGVFLEKGKWKKIVTHPILTVGMFTLRFLVGLRFIMR